MKKLLVFGLLSLSSQAFSQTCYVDLVDKTTLRILRTFTAVGNPDSCIEGMKECRKAIRFDYSNNPQYPNGTLDCVRPADVGPTPMPVPAPRPIPVPPRPQPRPDMEYPTLIRTGETVFNVASNRYAVIMGMDYAGKFLIRYTDTNQTSPGWNRADLAPLRGCDIDLCVNDEVFNTSSNRYARIVGMQMGGKFVIKYNDNGMVSTNWKRAELATLNGCLEDLCVNDEIFNVSSNRYAKVIGTMTTGQYIIKYNDNGMVSTGLKRSELAVLKGCAGDLCVGEEVFNASSSRFAKVVGVHGQGKYLLRYNDNGMVSSNWNRPDLAVLKGCQSGLCVGMRVFNQSSNRYARIQAIQMGNKFVIRYEDNGMTSAGWDLRVLVVIR